VTSTVQTLSDDLVREERVRLGIEGSGLGTWDLDLSTKELIWSATSRRLFGVSSDDPVSYNLFLSLLEPTDRERTELAIR
jgi:two-component system, LuxR family, sensor kinase FixL